MRAFVLALALLAGLKIWIQDSAYRSATEQALVAAYRDRAIAACKKEPPKQKSIASLTGVPVDWASQPDIHLTAGNSAVRVYIWQLDHELWNARFKNLYLILTASDPSLTCAYEIETGVAEITRT